MGITFEAITHFCDFSAVSGGIKNIELERQTLTESFHITINWMRFVYSYSKILGQIILSKSGANITLAYSITRVLHDNDLNTNKLSLRRLL